MATGTCTDSSIQVLTAQTPSYHGPLQDGPKHRQNVAAGLAALAKTVSPNVTRHFSRPVPHAQAVRAEYYEHHQTEGTCHPEGGGGTDGGEGQNPDRNRDINRDKETIEREDHERQRTKKYAKREKTLQGREETEDKTTTLQRNYTVTRKRITFPR